MHIPIFLVKLRKILFQITSNSSLLVYLPGCLGQETAKWPLQSSSQAATCYYQSNHSKGEAILIVSCPRTSEVDGLSSHYPCLMLNVKQGSCEYQLFTSFGPTRPGTISTQVAVFHRKLVTRFGIIRRV